MLNENIFIEFLTETLFFCSCLFHPTFYKLMIQKKIIIDAYCQFMKFPNYVT